MCPLSTATELALLQAEIAKRRNAKEDEPPRPNFLGDLFEQQRAIVTNGAFVSAWLAGRRYGKSVGASRWLLDGCFERPGTAQLFASKTRVHAKKVIWGEFKRALEKHGFKRVMGEPQGPREYSRNDTELVINFANGSSIHVIGLHSKEDADTIRGIMKIYRKFIDECGATRPAVLGYAAEECIEPASIDTEGPTVYAGTPGKQWHGFWFDMSGPRRTQNTPLFRGTMFENPHLPHARRLAEKIKKDRGWDDDHPTWQSEYLGNWAQDLTGVPLPLDPHLHGADALPEYRSPWQYVLGVDVAVVNKSGFCLWAYHDNDPMDWIVESRGQAGMLTGQVADVIKDYVRKYGARVVMDTGGMGKAHALEVTARYGIPVIPAEKRDKLSALRVFGDRIRSNAVRVLSGPKNDDIRDDCAIARWNDEKTDIEEEKKDPESHLDVAHAALYGHREMRNWLYAQEERRPEPGTEEFYKAEEKRLERAALRRFRQPKRPVYDR